MNREKRDDAYVRHGRLFTIIAHKNHHYGLLLNVITGSFQGEPTNDREQLILQSHASPTVKHKSLQYNILWNDII